MRLLITEWVVNYVPPEMFFNVSLLLNILTCNESIIKDNQVKETIYEDDETKGGILDAAFSYFYETPTESLVKSKTEENQGTKCLNLLHIDENYNISSHHAICGGSLVAFTLIFIFSFYLCCCRNFRSKNNKKFDKDINSIVSENSSQIFDNTLTKEQLNEKDRNDIGILNISFHKVNNAKNVKDLRRKLTIEDHFESTIGLFLKNLENLLGLEEISPRGDAASGASFSTISSSSINSVTSPRLARRVVNRPRNHSWSYGDGDEQTRSIREKRVTCWTNYERFCHRMKWLYPETSLHDVNIASVAEGDEKLQNILQFLYQNSSVSIRQWNTASLIVNYCMFILEQELHALNEDSKEFLKFSKFESFGSATDGTNAGNHLCFDVMAVLKVSGCSELNILHNNASCEIPPGHIIIGAKSEDSSLLCNSKFIKKCFLEGSYRFCISPFHVETFLDHNLRKVVMKLNDCKSKSDRLPFKIQLSSGKKLTVSVDTSLLQGLGLGFAGISIKCLPSIQLSVPSFCLLPPVYAMPCFESKEEVVPSRNPVKCGSLKRLIRPNTNSELFWNINVFNIESSVLQYFDSKNSDAGVISQHKLCIRVLKALFSESSKSMLLNKGEISPYIIKTVVSFLLQESAPSSWSLDNIPDRISDAVHFLRASFENRWLPSFVVHNPHLHGQLPGFKILSPLLIGRQHNLLSDVSEEASKKKLDYIETRLQKTGLAHCVKEDYSSNMWEYEFFMFG